MTKYTCAVELAHRCIVFYWTAYTGKYACNESWRNYDYCFGFNHE